MWLCASLALLVLVAGTHGACAPRDDFQVRVQEGVVRGCLMASRSGKDIASFRGIRYAKAPVGLLRFAAPVPADPWSTIFDAVSDAPQCIQKNYLIANPVVEGEEDCLFLNVYTNKLPSLNDNVKNKLPVMVYIHGGGWFTGSGASYMNGPEYLLDENVILVTFNYRLGALGFLSTEDDIATGNWALKDQTLALKWVQNNIERFGGDPDSVTIFGQSAGAASVHYLMLSQTTKGLFHKAISQSGTALNLWATPKNSVEIAKAQGAFVNCVRNSSIELIDCLRAVDAKELIQSGDKFKFWDVDPLTIYTPSIEKRTVLNPEPFLEDHPYKLIRNGKFHQIPFIVGVMENEGIIRAAPITSQPKLRNDLNSRWNRLGPELFALELSVPKPLVPKLWDNITNFYMTDGDLINQNNSKNIQHFVDMYSDRSFIYGVYQTALAHVEHSPIYFYKIEYNGKYSYSSLFTGTNQTVNHTFSVSHCDDLIYLFRAPLLFPDATSTDLDFSKLLVKLWTGFATNGKPFGRFWTPIKSTDIDQFRYLNMAGPNISKEKQGINLQMKNHFMTDRMDFWQNQNVEENR